MAIGCLEIPFREPKKKSNLRPLGRKLNFYPETFREFSKLWGDLVRKPGEVDTFNFYVLLLYPTLVCKPNLVKFWLRVLWPKAQQFLKIRKNDNPLAGYSALSRHRKWRELGEYSTYDIINRLSIGIFDNASWRPYRILTIWPLFECYFPLNHRYSKL